MSMKHRVSRMVVVSGLGLVAVGAVLWAVGARAAGIPAANALTYTGYLETPAGDPVTAEVSVSVALWSAASAGSKACEAATEKVTPVSGRFQITLPEPCTAAVKARPDLWLETTVDGAALGRTKLGAVPYAIEAGHATSADTATTATSATKAEATEKVSFGGENYTMQMGSFTGMSNESGYLDVPFTTPFEVSIDSVVITNAHAANDAVRGIDDSYTKTGFTVVMDPNKQTRINWIAIGR